MKLSTALKPLNVASQIIGINLDGRLGRIYTLTVFLTITSLLYASYIHLLEHRNVLFDIGSLITWTQLACNVVFVLVIIGFCIFRPKQYRAPFQDMQRIDTLLRFSGVDMNDSFLYRLQLVQIFFALLITALLTFRDICRIIRKTSFMIFFHWIHYSYAVLLSIITDCLFVDYLVAIKGRFFKLNELLLTIVRQNRLPTFDISSIEVSQRDPIGKLNTSSKASNFERIRIIHHDLCSISRKVNKSFGPQQLLSITISLVMMTGQLYEAFDAIVVHDVSAGMRFQKIMWIIFYVGRLFHTSYACSYTTYEANLASSIISKMPMLQVSNGIGAQMQRFSLQLIHENLKFNACGFFDIDFTLVRSIIGVVSTYLVILIQMDRKSDCTN